MAYSQAIVQRAMQRLQSENEQNEQSSRARIEMCIRDRGTGVEPASAAWEAAVLPMYEPCGSGLGYHIIFSSKMQPFSGENRKPGLRREARLVISRVLRRREWHRSA